MTRIKAGFRYFFPFRRQSVKVRVIRVLSFSIELPQV